MTGAGIDHLPVWSAARLGDPTNPVAHEQRLVGAALFNPEVTGGVDITGSMFADPRFGAIWDAVTGLHAAHIPQDILSVLEWVQANRPRVTVDHQLITSLVGMDVDADVHARHVRDAAGRRGLLQTFERAAQQLREGYPVAEVLDANPLPEAGGGGDSGRPASWQPVDLTAVLDGTWQPPRPSMLARTDGVCLLYSGCTHSMHGESESGKSLVMQYEAAVRIVAGADVLYIDFESDQGQVVARLRMFGATPEAILAHFRYVNPEQSPFTTGTERAAWRDLLADRYALTVIDGVTDSVGMFGYSSKDNDELSTWQRVFPDAIARETGAAVVSIDHVTKDGEGRGRFAIGAQAKMSGLTGAAYTVEVDQPLGLGLRGVVVLRVAKDRPGQVRPECGNWRKTDRTQEAARIIFDATGPEEHVTVEPWTARTDTGIPSGQFRPTVLMERVSRALEKADGELSLNTIKATVAGKAQGISTAIEVLIEEGFLRRRDGPNRSQLHQSVKPYRQTNDPHSDSYQDPGTTGQSESGRSE